ncbi:bifunctional Armadillo-like helical/Armadillo-type fold [Babesia duncani]|uniref:Bifunctional Armadillo-like helical/Armadillo-type fold n=1 Tax=Babesia duncani TaxID=323732 RepID=A0AAD9PN31_9APIC|nr:bifunctional Armadillo-like helical/Armadillo-type fold [Babesia duncani]
MKGSMLQILAASLVKEKGQSGMQAISLRNLPPVVLWNSYTEDDNISDVSSSGSSMQSKITQTEDSVSVMSSSSSSGSISTLGDSEPVRHIPYGSENVANMALATDELVHLEDHLQNANEVATQLHVCMCLWTCKPVTPSLASAEMGLHNIIEAHRLTCLFASIDLYFRISNRSVDTRVTDAFEIFFKRVASLYSISCETLPAAADGAIRRAFLEMIPYVVDIMYACGSRIHLHAQHDNLHLYENLLVSSIAIACSLCDDPQDNVRIGAAKALARISRITRPLELIFTIDTTTVDDIEMEHRTRVCESLRRIYMEDQFKSSALLLKNMAISYNTSRAAKAMERTTVSIGKNLFEAACTKRQYPSTNLDPLQCTCATFSRIGRKQIWNKLNFWMLLLLEDDNTQIRNLGLDIIQHMLCTCSIIEKQRQFVLSHVFNLLNEDSTFQKALDLLITISQIYPLKDGAIRKIATLTLKGSRTNTRLEAISALGKCRLTRRGIEAALSIFQTISQPIVYNETKTYATSSISDLESQVNFSKTEWPAIIKALHAANVKTKSPGEKRQECKCKNSISTFNRTPPEWLQLLACINGHAEDCQLVKGLYASEAKLWFPDAVPSNIDYTALQTILDAYLGIYKHFMDFNSKLEHEFVKDAQFTRSVIMSCKSKDGFDKIATMARSQIPGAIFDPNDNVKEAPEPEISIILPTMHAQSNWVKQNTSAMSTSYGSLNNTSVTYDGFVGYNDIDCLVFPAFLGTNATIKVEATVPQTCADWHAQVIVSFPQIFNGPKISPLVLGLNFNLISKVQDCGIYKACRTFTIQFPHPTQSPVKLTLTPCLSMPLREPLWGKRQFLWIHPLQTLG